MSDFEEQVGATLAAVAEEAPDASGLVAGARRRHRVRRQRRIAVGGVAAALVVAVSAVAIGTRGGGNPDIAEDPTEKPSATWQTISEGDARASLPPDWRSYDIPAWWGVGEDGDRSGYSTCVAVDHTSVGLRLDEQVDQKTYVSARPYSGMAVTVTAPTQAVAQLVMATVAHFPMISLMGDCAPEDFNVGLLPPEGSSGGPVEGEETAPATVTTADAAVALGADLERFHATEGEYPIDADTVARLIEAGDLAPIQPGNQLATYFELTAREPGVLFCLVNTTTGEYAAFDSTAGGLIGQGTEEPGDPTALNDACVAVINNS